MATVRMTSLHVSLHDFRSWNSNCGLTVRDIKLIIFNGPFILNFLQKFSFAFLSYLLQLTSKLYVSAVKGWIAADITRSITPHTSLTIGMSELSILHNDGVSFFVY